MPRVRSLALPALLALALAACGDAPPVAPASQSELEAPGPYGVATFERTFVDHGRPTPANGTYPGAAARTLLVKIWYPTSGDAAGGFAPPADGGPFPLIGYAHGYTSSRGESPEVKAHLASHGYVVVAPDFPLSNARAPGGPTIADLANQPADLAFAMDAVAHLDGAAGALSAAIDVGRRGIAGLSLGGGTTLLAVYDRARRIDGVSAAVAFAPFSCPFGPGLYSGSLPTMIVTGDADELVPFDTGPARAFSFAPGPLTLVHLRGGNHVGFIGIEIAGEQNADEAVGCTAVENAGTGGVTTVIDDLVRDAGADAADLSACGPGVCATKFVATMHAARQIELAKIATLAHFEAALRGRRDAARFLETSLATANPDVDVEHKP